MAVWSFKAIFRIQLNSPFRPLFTTSHASVETSILPLTLTLEGVLQTPI